MRCVICKKELPADSKFPICDYHAGLARENALLIGAGAASFGAGAYAFGKKYGKVVLKEGLAIVKTIAGKDS